MSQKTRFLGEKEVQQDKSPFKGYGRAEWAMELLERYGQFDGEHHKAFALDQIARVLKGSPVTITHATWSNGEDEWRLQVGESQEYRDWVDQMKGETDSEGEPEYEYATGIAP